MRWMLPALLVPLLCVAAPCTPAQQAAAPQADPHPVPLWHSGENGYDTYRIPGVVVTASGAVLAYGVGRRHLADGDWSDSDIVLRRSLDHGASWEPSRRIAGESHGVTDNPVAIASARAGVVYMLYQHDYATVHFMRSTDDGATFSAAVDVTPALADLRAQFAWTVVALGPGHAIELRGGRLLVPVWLAAGRETGQGRRAHAPSAITTLFSDDGGSSWKHGDLIAADSPEMKDPNEWQAVELADGRVMANIRTGDKTMRRAVAVSPDGATHWTRPAFDAALYDPICDAGIVRLSANQLVFSNPDSSAMPRVADGTRGRRYNLTLRMSADGGSTWPYHRLLVPGPTGYSDVAAWRDGTIYTIYEAPDQPGSKALALYIQRLPASWISSTAGMAGER